MTLGTVQGSRTTWSKICQLFSIGRDQAAGGARPHTLPALLGTTEAGARGDEPPAVDHSGFVEILDDFNQF
jgi:hypothetical protein